MYTVEWLAGDGTVLASDVSVAEDLGVAQGKALGRAIYLARKQAAGPAAYRIFDAQGVQVAGGKFPADLMTGKWSSER